VPPFGELGVTYTVHLWLVGKRVLDFLLVLIELFCQLLRLRRYEQILVEIVLFERGVGHSASEVFDILALYKLDHYYYYYYCIA